MCSIIVSARETRERWPLLTVETEVNEDSKRANERCPFLVGSLDLSCRYKRFLFFLGCSSRPSTNILIFYTSSIPLSPSLSKPGRPPCRVACLLLRVSGLTINTALICSVRLGYLQSTLCLLCWMKLSFRNTIKSCVVCGGC
jgi:hypothetical protein